MNPTPLSASTDNEPLRKKIIGSLSRAQVQNVDVMGEATIEREADHIMRLVAHHTKEAVERELSLLLEEKENVYSEMGYDIGHAHVDVEVIERRLAELSAPQQSTSPDGEQKEDA